MVTLSARARASLSGLGGGAGVAPDEAALAGLGCGAGVAPDEAALAGLGVEAGVAPDEAALTGLGVEAGVAPDLAQSRHRPSLKAHFTAHEVHFLLMADLPSRRRRVNCVCERAL